ncbi:MAG: hypothetical protein LBW85_01305 [Deltaproteobacteria bacterium]|jgi:hypothetical protein|nr:hypothetical protein [Deltaproteobacteria bacterium]
MKTYFEINERLHGLLDGLDAAMEARTACGATCSTDWLEHVKAYAAVALAISDMEGWAPNRNDDVG